jgi:L-asparaginase II
MIGRAMPTAGPESGRALVPMGDLLAVRTRSGLVETSHHGAVAAFDQSGSLVVESGDIDRVFYLRSSAKPFQAFVAQQAGAALTRQQLAIACASHDGDPVHIALVGQMLNEVGLDETALGCPASFPIGESARDLATGLATGPRRIWHNCSGKHAAWLRACVANSWPLDTYLDPAHPLQTRIREEVSDLGGFSVDPVGVDGCGAPVLRTTVRSMAMMFMRFATERRFDEAFGAMHAYPALVSGVGNGDALLATAFHGAAKRGAAGCIGVAIKGQFGLAAKSWDGIGQVAAMAVAHALAHISPLVPAAAEILNAVLEPPVFGGGEVVGHLESRLEL